MRGCLGLQARVVKAGLPVEGAWPPGQSQQSLGSLCPRDGYGAVWDKLSLSIQTDLPCESHKGQKTPDRCHSPLSSGWALCRLGGGQAQCEAGLEGKGRTILPQLRDKLV